MVARGRGKKAAAVGPAVASEAEAVVSNGDVSQEAEAASEVVATVAPTKKSRQRGVKKETKEEVDETPLVEVAEKPAKPAKAAKGSKKGSKVKASASVAVAEEEEKVTIAEEDTKDEVLSENDSNSIENKIAAVIEKKAPIRKRKVDSTEKTEDSDAVTKKAPRVTKTKGAKKETVDSEGIPEDPAAAGVSITVLPATQTKLVLSLSTADGTKKSSSRKRGAPKIEEPEPVTDEPISEAPNQAEEAEEDEEEVAPAPAKKGSKSKSSKKEPKETKKSAPKTKGSKKALKAAEEAEEEVTEHDVLPEDEFVPEIEEEEEEPKPKKVVKSKGSRKQVVPAPVEEEKIQEPVIEEETEEPTASEPQESEADSASAIDEEQQPTKSKGRKAATAAKKEKAPAKKTTSKKGPKGKKATKDETKEDQQPAEDEDKADNLNKINEENQDAAADVKTSKRKINGTATPAEEPVAEPKAGRGRKRTATATPIAEMDDTEKKPGRGRKRVAPAPLIEEGADDEADGSKVAKSDGTLNPTKTEYNSSDFTTDKNFNLKISSWNIAGLRAWLKKDGLAYLQHEQPDILCLQEIKCSPEKLPEEARIPGYHPYWLSMPSGNAGVAVYSKIMPINVEYGIGNTEHDAEGRIITAEYEKFYLISVYVPNSGRQLVNLDKRMEWEGLFREYLQKLEKVKPVIIAGDMNVSHKEIDLANPKTNTKNAGFTPQERDEMTKLLASGYVDTFRHFHPDQKGAYTFWTYLKNARAKNVGWRLDYFILSERILSKVVESTIRPQVLGSDHCPITLFLNI